MGILDEDVARVREVTDLVALAERAHRAEAGRPSLRRAVPVPHREVAVVLDQSRARCLALLRLPEERRRDHVHPRGRASRLRRKRSNGSRRAPASRCATTTLSFSEERKRKQRLHEAVRRSDQLLPTRCCSRSPDAGNARRYLRSRGYDGDVVRRFSLGFAPDGYDTLSRHLQNKKFSRQDIVDAGLGVREPHAEAAGPVPRPAHVPDLGHARRSRSASAAARSTATDRSTRTRPRRRSTRSRGCSTACTGRRARSSHAARS